MAQKVETFKKEEEEREAQLLKEVAPTVEELD
jgi:hypothetical protein